LEMTRDLGGRIVQGLALQEPGELRAGLAALARRFLLAALGLDPLVLFLLRTDRVGLGQVDVALRARFAATRVVLAGLALGLAPGFGGRLEAEAKQLVAEGIAHQ